MAGRNLGNPQVESKPTRDDLDLFYAAAERKGDPEIIAMNKAFKALGGDLKENATKAFHYMHKYLALQIILNDGSLKTLLPERTNHHIMESYFPFFFLNTEDAFEEGYRRAEAKEGRNVLDRILHLSAFALGPDLFARLYRSIGFNPHTGTPADMKSDYFRTVLDQKAAPLFRHIPPVVFIAAFSNNVELLRFIDKTTDGGVSTAITDGLSVVHFAAMGGAVDVLEYCHTELKMPIDFRTHDGLTAFRLSAAGNNFLATKKLLELGFKPTAKDIEYFNTFFDKAQVIEFYRRFPPHICVDMKEALRELALVPVADPVMREPEPVIIPDAPSVKDLPSEASEETRRKIIAKMEEITDRFLALEKRASLPRIGSAALQEIFEEAGQVFEFGQIALCEFVAFADNDESIRITLENAMRDMDTSFSLVRAHTAAAIPQPALVVPQPSPSGRSVPPTLGSAGEPERKDRRDDDKPEAAPSPTLASVSASLAIQQSPESKAVCADIRADVNITLSKLRTICDRASTSYDKTELKSLFETAESLSSTGVENLSKFFEFIDDAFVSMALEQVTREIEDQVEAIKRFTSFAKAPAPLPSQASTLRSVASLPSAYDSYDSFSLDDLNRSTDFPSPVRSAPRSTGEPPRPSAFTHSFYSTARNLPSHSGEGELPRRQLALAAPRTEERKENEEKKETKEKRSVSPVRGTR